MLSCDRRRCSRCIALVMLLVVTTSLIAAAQVGVGPPTRENMKSVTDYFGQNRSKNPPPYP